MREVIVEIFRALSRALWREDPLRAFGRALREKGLVAHFVGWAHHIVWKSQDLWEGTLEVLGRYREKVPSLEGREKRAAWVLTQAIRALAKERGWKKHLRTPWGAVYYYDYLPPERLEAHLEGLRQGLLRWVEVRELEALVPPGWEEEEREGDEPYIPSNDHPLLQKGSAYAELLRLVAAEISRNPWDAPTPERLKEAHPAHWVRAIRKAFGLGVLGWVNQPLPRDEIYKFLGEFLEGTRTLRGGWAYEWALTYLGAYEQDEEGYLVPGPNRELHRIVKRLSGEEPLWAPAEAWAEALDLYLEFLDKKAKAKAQETGTLREPGWEDLFRPYADPPIREKEDPRITPLDPLLTTIRHIAEGAYPERWAVPLAYAAIEAGVGVDILLEALAKEGDRFWGYDPTQGVPPEVWARANILHLHSHEPEVLGEEEPEVLDPVEIERVEWQIRVQDALNDLPSPLGEIVMRIYVDGDPLPAVAEEAGIPEVQLQEMVDWAVAQLRERLADWAE